MLTINNIQQIAAGFIPEASIEGFACEISILIISSRTIVISILTGPLSQQPESVVPERIYFHSLSPPWSNYPVTNLGVHPGQLKAFSSLNKKPVLQINADSEMR